MNQFKIYTTMFHKNLDEIESYIRSIEIQKETLIELKNFSNSECSKDNFQKIISYSDYLEKTLTSPIQYNAAIISLYGSFEFFIDEIFKKFIELIFLNKNNYDDLPKGILDKHLSKTGEFFMNPQRFKNYELTNESVIENLYNCINNNQCAKLNEELILYHGGNLRFDQISILMKDFGIKQPLEQIIFNDKYIDFYSNKENLHLSDTKKYIGEIKSSPNFESILFSELNNLISERNKVAHGWIIENRISYSIIKDEIIKFLKLLGSIIEEILFKEYCIFLKKTNKLNGFQKPIQVINRTILCINSCESKLKINDYIFAENEKGFHPLKIINLRINNDDVSCIEDINIDIGIEVDNNIKDNWRYYYYK